jgi:hypothetical protein
VEVSARLRSTARATKRGPSRLADAGDQRRALARFVAEEAEEVAEIRRSLSGGRRLSELELDAAAWPLFLRLLGEVVAVADEEGRAATETADGTFHVALAPLEGERRAHVTSPDGVLTADRDYLLIVEEIAAGPGAASPAEVSPPSQRTAELGAPW